MFLIYLIQLCLLTSLKSKSYSIKLKTHSYLSFDCLPSSDPFMFYMHIYIYIYISLSGKKEMMYQQCYNGIWYHLYHAYISRYHSSVLFCFVFMLFSEINAKIDMTNFFWCKQLLPHRNQVFCTQNDGNFHFQWPCIIA